MPADEDIEDVMEDGGEIVGMKVLKTRKMSLTGASMKMD